MTPQAQALLARIERDLARDARNQAMFDQMRRGSWKGRMMGRYSRHPFAYSILSCTVVWAILLTAGISYAWSDELHVPCPTPGQPCKVLLLTPQEEGVLMQQNGVLDTAAQARALELGQFSVYLKTRIATAPQGDVKPLPVPVQIAPAIPAPAPPAVDIAPKDVVPN